MNNLFKSFSYAISMRRLQFPQIYKIVRIKIVSFKKLLILGIKYEPISQSICVLDALINKVIWYCSDFLIG